jgi:hypothetical protein
MTDASTRIRDAREEVSAAVTKLLGAVLDATGEPLYTGCAFCRDDTDTWCYCSRDCGMRGCPRAGGQS